MRFLKIILLSVLLCKCAFSVLAQNEKAVVKNIFIYGNKKTKAKIIYRELTFKINDSLDISNLNYEIEVSTNNLLKTTLFNFVNINTNIENGKIDFEIIVQERWYYWVYPIFEYADRSLSSFLHYKDFYRINYGVAFDWHNFMGNNDLLRFKLRLGYKEHYSISYNKKGLGEKKIFGIWAISEYFRQKETINKILENKPVYAENKKKYIKELLNVGAGLTYRPEINYKFNIGILYQNSIYKDTTLFFDNNSINNDKFYTHYLIPRLRFEYDNRNSIIYPTKGIYANFLFTANIGISEMSENYYTINTSVELNKAIFRDFIFYKISTSYHNFLNHSSHILFDKKNEFCKDYMIRGYEYYYIISPQFINLQNTVNFKIGSYKIHYLPNFLPDEFRKTYTKLFLDIFFDCAYSNNSYEFYNETNSMRGKFIYSFGAGLNLETYYDRLIQIHAAYNGHLNKIGIFVEYKAPLYKLY